MTFFFDYHIEAKEDNVILTISENKIFTKSSRTMNELRPLRQYFDEYGEYEKMRDFIKYINAPYEVEYLIRTVDNLNTFKKENTISMFFKGRELSDIEYFVKNLKQND